MEISTNENEIFAQAVAFVNYTNRHIFLTGKAGTGKTTFLKYIKEHCAKKLAVVAPTGVAAINAGGVTIHSFFQLPLGTFLPTLKNTWGNNEEQQIFNKHQLLSKLRLNRNKRQLIRELELLIIDEVSMVRCDVLDAMDETLRHIRQKPNVPFGGVQMLYIGDLFQLPPVIKNSETNLLNEFYASSFFFDAVALKTAMPLCLELKKIYRQSNISFIELLNKIRNNETAEDDLSYLNSFYQPDFSPDKNENYITIATHNYIADNINQQALKALPGKAFSYEAKVEGDFPERMYPMDKTLHLKEGAQIMFIKNDKGEDRKYFNGKIGIIDSISDSEIKIRFKDEPELLDLNPEKWQNIRYQYNDENDKIDEEELGTFSQLPVRLAWAITIHKSQGLTFDKAVIDAGAAFADGQVYVALSRLRSLDGLVLRSKIFASAISTNPSVLNFYAKEISPEPLNETLAEEQKQFVYQSVINAFDWSKLAEILKDYTDEQKENLFTDDEDETEQMQTALNEIAVQKNMANKFIRQLDDMLKSAETEGFGALHSRVSSASEWFAKTLNEKIIQPVNKKILLLQTKKRTGKLQKQLTELLLPFERKQQQMQQATALTKSMCASASVDDWLRTLQQNIVAKKEQANVQPVEKSIKTPTKEISFNLYKEGKSIDQISRERNLAKSTIEGHLLSFVSSGEVDVSVFINEEEIKILQEYFAKNPEQKDSDVFRAFNEKYSYSKIKAARLNQLIIENG